MEKENNTDSILAIDNNPKKRKRKQNSRSNSSSKKNKVSRIKRGILDRCYELDIAKQVDVTDECCIASCEECAAGNWFGPLITCSCVLGPTFSIPDHLPLLNDSKKLSLEQREKIYNYLVSHPDVVFTITTISSKEIDESNILACRMKGMTECVAKIKTMIQEKYKDKVLKLVLVDGNRIPSQLQQDTSLQVKAIVKGDTLCQSIAAASILCKQTHYREMIQMDKLYPQYGFLKHSGYGTIHHQEMLKKYGPTDNHRFSYAPIKRIALLKTNTTDDVKEK